MNRTEQKETKIEIGLPQGAFPRTMFFNRFRVDREPGFRLVQFGLIAASDLVDSYSCVLSGDVLKENEARLIQYLTRIGRATESHPAEWRGVLGLRVTNVADVVTMAYRGHEAETCLYAFSLATVTQVKKDSGSEPALVAQPVALLRSAADLQKQLIVALYEE